MRNSHRIVRYIIIAAVIALLLPVLSIAQDSESETHPLLDMLALVPDTENTRQQYLIYSDYEATRQVRGVPPIASYAEWEALADSEDGREALHAIEWQNNTLRFSAIPDLQQAFNYADETETQMGINFFAIERALYHASPPFDSAMLVGDFDENSIIAAYEAKDYVVLRQDTLMHLCPVAGCASGADIAPDQREPGNLFGGSLGRSQAVVVLDDILLSSPDEAVMTAWLAVQDGTQAVLLDDPVLQTLAAATIDTGTVRHALFYPDALTVVEGSAGAENVVDVAGIPLFEALAFADIADESPGVEYGALLIVFDSEDKAIRATDAILSNLRNEALRSGQTKMPFGEMIAQRGTLKAGEVYVSPDSDYYVARILIEAPLLRYGTVADMMARGGEREVVEALPEEGRWRPVMNNFAFRVWLNAFTRFDLAWLQVIPE